MEIDFIGEGAVAKLMSAGHVDVIEIINKSFVLGGIIGENGRKAAEMMNKILNETTPQRLFAALGSFGRGLGERKLKVVFDKYSVEQVLSGSISLDEYCELPGYDVKSAQLLVENASRANEIYEQIKNKIKFRVQEEKVLGTGILVNQVIVATGVRLSPEIISKIESLGGEVTDSFNKQTTLLITKDPNSTSGKAQKARDSGIKVISLSQLNSMLG